MHKETRKITADIEWVVLSAGPNCESLRQLDESVLSAGANCAFLRQLDAVCFECRT